MNLFYLKAQNTGTKAQINHNIQNTNSKLFVLCAFSIFVFCVFIMFVFYLCFGQFVSLCWFNLVD